MYSFERITSVVRHEGDLTDEIPVTIAMQPLDRSSRLTLALNAYALTLLPPVETSNQSELISRKSAVESSRTILDLSAAKIHHQQLAEIDALTGTKSQREFNNQFPLFVEQAHVSDKPLVFAYIDLDNFKRLNDEKGHNIGDKLLTRVGHALLGATRASDFVSRAGGDEFQVLYPDFGSDRSYSGTELLERMDRAGLMLRSAVNKVIREEPYVPNDLQVGASVGIGMLGANEDSRAFFDRVEALMYDDKNRRKDFMNQQ
jgi:diguanylate cyclase (GGDEF)-like protein